METKQPPDMPVTPSVVIDTADLKEEILATIPKSASVQLKKRPSLRRKEVVFTDDSEDEESIEDQNNDALEVKEIRRLNDVIPDHAVETIEGSHKHTNNDSNDSSSTPDEVLPRRLTLRERAEKLMRKGSINRNSVVHHSVDMLNEKALATKTIDSFAEQTEKLTEKVEKKPIKDSPKSDTPHSATSLGPTPSARAILESRTVPLRSGSPLSPIAGSSVALDKDSDMPTNSTRALNAETKSIFGRPSAATGYQKGRTAISGTAETKSIYGDLKGSPVEGPTGASYATMSALRSNKASNMLSRNGSQASLGATESPKTQVPTPKTFKEFFAHLLRAHDSIFETHVGQDKHPNSFKLETIFGSSSDGFDPMDRLLWIAAQYQDLRKESEWADAEDGAQIPALSNNRSKNVRIIDIEIEDPVPGLEIDTSQIEGLSMVISGSLKALFDGLIIPIEQDMSYVEVFLACYRFFTTPRALFQNLEEWYFVTDEGSLLPGADSMLKNAKRQIQSRTIRVLLLWIRNHWQDFQSSPELMADLENFTHGLSKISFGDNQKLIHAIREQKLSWFTSQYIPMFSGIKAQDSGKLWNIEMDTDAFAQNLTALDNLFFRQMRPDYYLRLLASESKMAGGAYNIALNTILSYCGWFRMVVGYVPGIIAKEENTKKRTASLRLFLKIAKSCLDLGNYAGALAITCGLKTPACLVWVSAWEALPAKHMDCFKELCFLADHQDGYKNYWDEMKSVKLPAIPFIVPYMQDLVMMDKSAVPTIDEETDIATRKIFFQKFYDMFSVAAELETFRLSSYHDKLKVDKDSTGLLLQHIRHISQSDDEFLGLSLRFSTGKAPEKNEILTSSTGQKAIKKAMHLLE